MGGMTGLIFGLILPWRLHYAFPLWPWMVLAALAFAAFFIPTILQLPYKIWMRFGLVLNAIMSRLILGIVYYLAIVPTGILFRIQKKDPMCRKFDKDIKTYRIQSSPANPDQMRKPF
jgi:hypothetical protein